MLYLKIKELTIIAIGWILSSNFYLQNVLLSNFRKKSDDNAYKNRDQNTALKIQSYI